MYFKLQWRCGGRGNLPGDRSRVFLPREAERESLGWRSVWPLWTESGWFLAERLGSGWGEVPKATPVLSFRMVPHGSL